MRGETTVTPGAGSATYGTHERVEFTNEVFQTLQLADYEGPGRPGLTTYIELLLRPQNTEYLRQAYET